MASLVAVTESSSGARGLSAAELARAWYPRVRRFAAFVASSDSDADDIAQEAMITAIGNLDRYDSKRGSLQAWLWRIVVSRGRDLGRVARRQSLLVDRISTLQLPLQDDRHPEEQALDRIRDQELVTAVRQLPKRHRTLIALRYGAGLPMADVASALGVTRMAAAKATARALQDLRKHLHEDQP